MTRQDLVRDVAFLINRLESEEEVGPDDVARVVVQLVGRACANLVEDDGRAWGRQRDRSSPDSDSWHECNYRFSALRKAGGSIRLLTGARDELLAVDDD